MPPRFPRRWQLATADEQGVAHLCDALGIQPLTARILCARGLSDPDQAHAYLHPDYAHLGDPWLMHDMDKAVRRTLQAIHTRQHILVFGDYDVDGVTAASTAFQYLRRLGLHVDYQIARRSTEGYGLTVSAVRELHANGVQLLITTDCGVSALEEIREAQRLGVDTIVIDHHALPEELPPATAILNPLQPQCRFPYKRLAAVGVAFNYIRALHERLCALGAFPGQEPDLSEYLDIVALGTVADAVPLTGDNRALVRMGLEVLGRRRRPGVSALMERAQIDNRPVTTRTIGYRLAPLLNAAGRVGHAARCVELLAADSYQQADKLARELERDNIQRQRFERQVIGEAIAMAEREYGAGRRLLMLSGEHWHEGILGIVASRIKEMFHRPTALVSVSPTGRARVSLRSIEGIDLIAALRVVEPHLDSFGGHTAAAGMTLQRDKLEMVRAALDDAIRAQVPEMPLPTLRLDTHCLLGELNDAFLDDLQHLAPFGSGNPEPNLVARQLRSLRRRVISQKHLRVQLRQGEETREVIGFALAKNKDLLRQDIDAAITPRHGIYRGASQMELHMRDLRPCGFGDEEPFGECDTPCWDAEEEPADGVENVS
jgi:single-stranded-DNA-specific exonuclease